MGPGSGKVVGEKKQKVVKRVFFFTLINEGRIKLGKSTFPTLWGDEENDEMDSAAILLEGRGHQLKALTGD